MHHPKAGVEPPNIARTNSGKRFNPAYVNQ